MNVGNKLFSAVCWLVFQDFFGMKVPDLEVFEEPSSESDKELIQFAIDLAVGKSNVTPNVSTPLKPVLQLVGQSQLKKKDVFIPPSRLSLGKDDFPFPEETVEGFKGAAEQQLRTCLKVLSGMGSGLQPDSALSLFEAYLTTLPCGYEHLADVSLYDHLKSVLAYADCLHTYLENEQKSLKEMKADLNATPFRMIGADVSGIQKFIYDIVSKNAAKNLKGRSFYLDLLVDSVIQRLLKEFALSSAHIIYASGGGFYLLAPNTGGFEEKLNMLKKELQDGLYTSHKTSLFLSLDSITVRLEDLFIQQGTSISGLWSELIALLKAQKQSRFSDRLVDHYQNFFEPIEVGGKTTRDAITDEEFTAREHKEALGALDNQSRKRFGKSIVFLDDVRDEDDKVIGVRSPVKRLTYKQIELGRELREAVYWISTFESIHFQKAGSNEIIEFQPCELGVFHYFFTSGELEKNLSALPKGARILKINDLETESLTGGLKDNMVGFTFYGGNKFPEDDETKYPVETDKLIPEKAEFRRIGLLRMDVDNLGQLFIDGFSEDQKTFSRFSALSRNLDLFFKGYLNTILKPFIDKKAAYILYAGGDDLFILGHWLDMMEVAEQIRADFNRMTANNAAVSLSAGLAILTHKFPIMLGADYAADAEKQAKGHVYKENGLSAEKNSYSFLQKALNWEYEFPIVKELKEKLTGFLVKENGKPALLSDNILSRIQLHAHSQETQRALAGSTEKWYWNLMYDLSQIQGRVKRPSSHASAGERQSYDEAMAFLEDLKLKAVTQEYSPTQTSNYTYLQLMALAARWANLENRTNKSSGTYE